MKKTTEISTTSSKIYEDREEREISTLDKTIQSCADLIGNRDHLFIQCCLQLLTVGKIKIKLNNYTLRIELTNKEDIFISKAVAIQIIEEYIESTGGNNEDFGITQRITVQPSKKR